MFVSDQIIYLQLQKTACTHISRVLGKYVDGKQVGKHGPLVGIKPDKLIIGSIRNPWDWYVSLWAYGCKRQGIIYSELTAPPAASLARHVRETVFHPQRWWELRCRLNSNKPWREFRTYYQSSESPVQFQQWLKAILAGKDAPYMGNDFPFIPISSQIGLLTYRFLSLFISNDVWQPSHRKLVNSEEVHAMYKKHCIVDRFIRMESLEHDLFGVLHEIGENVDIEILKEDKTNASVHRDIGYYYDEETVRLVAEKEAILIKEFSYAAPLLSRGSLS